MTTRMIQIAGQQGDLDRIKTAAEVVEAGGLVAFPTETVYGIACCTKKRAIARLDELKGRTTEKHYTLHIGQVDEYRRYVPGVGLRAGKLARKAWPGPLTLVFRLTDGDLAEARRRIDSEAVAVLYKNHSIGIRCPDHPVASLLLRAAKGPVIAPSANLAQKEPATDAGQVFSQLSGRIDLVLDGGPCKYGRSSTVATISDRGVEVLREGVYSQAQLKSMSQMIFLFVCTGNTCRSPMAEGLFRRYLAEKIGCTVDDLGQMGYKVYSAGTMDLAGMPASTEAVVACGQRGVDIRNHTSQPLTPSLVEDSDFIFCMARAHCEKVVALSPDAESKCFLMAQDHEVPDPIGRPQEHFDNCADIIEAAVKTRVRELTL